MDKDWSKIAERTKRVNNKCCSCTKHHCSKIAQMPVNYNVDEEAFYERAEKDIPRVSMLNIRKVTKV